MFPLIFPLIFFCHIYAILDTYSFLEVEHILLELFPSHRDIYGGIGQIKTILGSFRAFKESNKCKCEAPKNEVSFKIFLDPIVVNISRTALERWDC